jgi:hypothetical protein
MEGEDGGSVSNDMIDEETTTSRALRHQGTSNEGILCNNGRKGFHGLHDCSMELGSQVTMNILNRQLVAESFHV